MEECSSCVLEEEVEEYKVYGVEDEEEDEECGVCGDEELLRLDGGEAKRMKADRGEGEVKMVVDPRMPSSREVDEHWLRDHLPYRNWCKVSIAAKGVDMDHRASLTQERSLSEYCFDYDFPADEFGCRVVILVGRERVSWANFATAILTRMVTGQFEGE